MTWRDQLGTVKFPDGRVMIGASFRGVVFFIDTSEREGGRRTVVHQYPKRDQPFVEDMGMSARRFPVEGYVLGADYVTQRDALLGVLEQEGPGELLHPYYGTRSVIAATFRVRETSSDGGLARFQIDFEETPAQPLFPSASPAAGDQVAASVSAASAAAGAGFTAAYSVTSLPSYALESAQGIVSAAGAALEDQLSPFVTETQQLATLKKQLDDLTIDAAILVSAPAKVFGALTAVLESLATPPLLPSLGLQGLLNVYGFVPASQRPPATTSVRVQEQANWDALLRLVQTLIIIEAAQLATIQTFDSYEAAVAAREAITGGLADQMDGADDDTFQALEQLQADLLRAVPGAAADLPRLMTYTPVQNVPSLVLAQRLYGDVTMEADLIARNDIARPGFIQGGLPLEVLSDG